MEIRNPADVEEVVGLVPRLGPHVVDPNMLLTMVKESTVGDVEFNLQEINSSPDAAGAYERARQAYGEAFHADDLGPYVAVLSYEEVRRAAADNVALVSGEGATIPQVTPLRAIPTEVDLPDHREYRRLLQPELRPDRVQRLEARMAHLADETIDEMIESGRGDLRRLAERLPASIMAEVLGFPEEGTRMLEMADRLNRAAGQSSEIAAEARRNFAEFVNDLVTRAESDSGDTGLLGLLARSQAHGEDLTHETLTRMAMSLVLAGHETTVNGISSLLWLLGTHLHVKDRIINDRSLVPPAIEEALRLESPVSMMGRTAAQDLEIGDVEVGPGEKVGLFFGAANLDPAKFESPAQFKLDRKSSSHLAFGHGIHRCVGEHLARAEMRVATERVLDRIPDYRVEGTATIGANIAMNRGLTAVPVSFTPGRRSDAG